MGFPYSRANFSSSVGSIRRSPVSTLETKDCGRSSSSATFSCVSAVLEIHPVEFFRLVFKEPTKQSPILLRMQAIFGAVRPAAAAPSPSAPRPEVTLDALRRRVEELARQLDQLARRER